VPHNDKSHITGTTESWKRSGMKDRVLDKNRKLRGTVWYFVPDTVSSDWKRTVTSICCFLPG